MMRVWRCRDRSFALLPLVILRAFAFLGITALLSPAGPALAASCSERAGACHAACTPQLVSSGEQAGGTVAGCHSSCATRLQQCMHSGVWVHMGAQRRGLQEQVERR
jgi:hypothetical protein